jgi:hypothetical protein
MQGSRGIAKLWAQSSRIGRKAHRFPRHRQRPITMQFHATAASPPCRRRLGKGSRAWRAPDTPSPCFARLSGASVTMDVM